MRVHESLIKRRRLVRARLRKKLKPVRPLEVDISALLDDRRPWIDRLSSIERRFKGVFRPPEWK